MKISDSGPLIVLYNVSLLYILKELYGEIIVPKAVFDEITRKEVGKRLFADNSWIIVKNVKNEQLKTVFESFVDVGEAEAISLSLKYKVSLLIDDKKGRELAKSVGIHVQGCLGVLIKAKKIGIIKSVREAIAKILAAGYYLDIQLINEVLKYAGEIN